MFVRGCHLQTHQCTRQGDYGINISESTVFSALTLSDGSYQDICTAYYCPMTVGGVTRSVRPVIGIFTPLHYQNITHTLGPEDFIHEWLVLVTAYTRYTDLPV